MSLTKKEVLDLFVHHCTEETVKTRIRQMYDLLGPGQQAAAYNVIKADVLEVFNTTMSNLEETDSSLVVVMSGTQQIIDDIENASNGG